MPRRSVLPGAETIRRVTRRRSTKPLLDGTVATDDQDVIREWAARQGAEPATGEATSSGPATIHVHDGGAGIRFNFPAAAQYRPLTWDEWFENFTRHDLMFVFEGERPGRPPSAWYRLVPRQKLRGQWSAR